jgi:hypothetical protein
VKRGSVGTWALAGLVAGLAAGAAVNAAHSAVLRDIGSAVEVVGTLWINAILMTILPLVVAKVVTSIAGQAGACRAAPLWSSRRSWQRPASRSRRWASCWPSIPSPTRSAQWRT